MKLIAITTPNFWRREALIIRRLIDSGWYRVHIRKPEASPAQISELIENIPANYRRYISLHDSLDLAVTYGLGGVHLNRRNPHSPAGWNGMISRSCHSLEEVEKYSRFDYVTLSPIYDSISKPGYKSHFSSEELKKINLKKVYALGGVTFSRISDLEALGFEGAAMLSEAWKKRMENLQYITYTDKDLEAILRGGCRWVQLRMKDATDAQFTQTAKRMLSICRKYDATFILDDRVHLVEEIEADGVHLGKKDLPISEARKILAPSMIIGATANTEEDILTAFKSGADYIGLGPFRFTPTKKGLSPILGLQGYQRLVSYCRHNDINIPLVAIGGIRIDDIDSLKQTGVSGIAVSGLILNSANKEFTTKEILRLWKN